MCQVYLQNVNWVSNNDWKPKQQWNIQSMLGGVNWVPSSICISLLHIWLTFTILCISLLAGNLGWSLHFLIKFLYLMSSSAQHNVLSFLIISLVIFLIQTRWDCLRSCWISSLPHPCGLRWGVNSQPWVWRGHRLGRNTVHVGYWASRRLGWPGHPWCPSWGTT